MSLTQLASDLGGLRKGVKLVQTELEAYNPENKKDNFKAVMEVINAIPTFSLPSKSFYQEASAAFAKVEASFKDAEEAFKKVLQFYCEDPKVTPEEFFGVLHTVSISNKFI